MIDEQYIRIEIDSSAPIGNVIVLPGMIIVNPTEAEAKK